MKRLGFALTAIAIMLALSGPAADAASAKQPLPAGVSCPDGITPTLTNVTVSGQQPPAGFRPDTASSGELARYGFPPRPGNGHDGEWLASMKSFKHKATTTGPAWTCGNVSHGQRGSDSTVTPAGLGGSGSHFNNKWAGNQVSFNLNGDAYDSYTAATLRWVLPIPVNDPNGAVYSETSIWPGIGTGQNGGQLVQAGTESWTQPNSSYTYNLWYEVYPYQKAVYVYPFNINHGDQLYIQVWYAGQIAYFYISNDSHGQSVQYSENFTGRTGDSAEWIVEKSGDALSGWGPANPFNMTGEFVGNGTWFCAGTHYHWSYHLTNSAGQDMAHGLAWTDPPNYCTFPMFRANVNGQ